MKRAPREGMILVAVLLLTLATWVLLAAMLSVAYLQYRLALGAERGAVAGAAARATVDDLALEARTGRVAGDPWPTSVTVEDMGTCSLLVTDVTSNDTWWRIGVRATFEGAVAVREVTVRVP